MLVSLVKQRSCRHSLLKNAFASKLFPNPLLFFFLFLPLMPSPLLHHKSVLQQKISNTNNKLCKSISIPIHVGCHSIAGTTANATHKSSTCKIFKINGFTHALQQYASSNNSAFYNQCVQQSIKLIACAK